MTRTSDNRQPSRASDMQNDPLLRDVARAMYGYLVQGSNYACSFDDAERKRTRQYFEVVEAAKIFARYCVADGLGDPVLI